MHKLALQADFYKCLEVIGRLPKMTFDDVTSLEKQNQDLLARVEELEDQVRQLKGE